MNIVDTLIFYCFIVIIKCQIQDVNQTKISRQKRIIGDNKAEAGQFPYHVSVLKKKGMQRICGGSILNKNHVLSAAHCFVTDFYQFRNYSMVVVAGVTDFSDENSNKVTIGVQKIYIPRDYFDANFDIIRTGDIAVMRLKRSFNLGGDLVPVNLPWGKTQTYINHTAIISGFGYTTIKIINNGNISRDLGRTDLSMRYAYLKVTKCPKNTYIRPINRTKHMCAKIDRKLDNSQGLCKGDSGNSLVMERTRTVIGVHSRNIFSCNNTVSPVIMTRVTAYLNFIKIAMSDKSTTIDGFHGDLFVYRLPSSSIKKLHLLSNSENS